MIGRELSLANSDQSLMVAVARNAAKTIDWFNIKVEEMVDPSDDAHTIRQPCTRGMQRNIALANRLFQLHTRWANRGVGAVVLRWCDFAYFSFLSNLVFPRSDRPTAAWCRCWMRRVPSAARCCQKRRWR